jgi:hypothetical protein
MKNTGMLMMMVAAAGLAVSAEELTNAQREEFLRTAKIVKRKELSMGVTGSSKAEMDNGSLQHAAHVQTVDIEKSRYETPNGVELNFRDCYRYNVAAYEIAKLLELDGMVPPSVERAVPGGHGAVTWWIDDVQMTELDRFKRHIDPPSADEWARQMNIVHAFDQLIYNTDRNLGNLIITKDWHVWMIDHTRAFRWQRNCQNLKMVKQIDRKLLAKRRELDRKTLQQRVGKYLSKNEIDGVLARRDELVQHVDQEIASAGEAKVVYDWMGRFATASK